MNDQLRLCVLFAVLATPSPAQQAELPDGVPNPPYVQRAPDFAAWTVRVQWKNEPAPPPPVIGTDGRERPAPNPKLLIESQVTKTGAVLRDIRIYREGGRTENWVVDGMILQQHPEQGYVTMLNPRTERMAPRFDLTDFEGLSWIDAKHYSGDGTKNGSKCHIYAWEKRKPAPEDILKLQDRTRMEALIYEFMHKPEVPTKVWIDQDTRWPVFIEDENATYTYEFSDPPTAMLKLSGAFKKLWDEYKAELADIEARRMPRVR